MRYYTSKLRAGDNILRETTWLKVPRNHRLSDIHCSIHGQGDRLVDPFPQEVRDRIKELFSSGYDLNMIDSVVTAEMEKEQLPSIPIYVTKEPELDARL